MRHRTILLLGCVLAGGIWSPATRWSESPQSGDPFVSDPFFLDDLLAWRGSRHGTLGPTGGRLFAETLHSEPGFRGRFCYIHYSEDLTDLARVEFIDSGGALTPRNFQETWHPSFHETTFELADINARERKFIRDDDVAVSIMRFTNPGTVERRIAIQVTSPGSDRAAFRLEQMVPLDLGVLANRSPSGELFAAGRGTAVRVGGVPFVLIEAIANSGRAMLGLRGGSSGSATEGLPTALEIPVNQRVRRLHLLGQIEDMPAETAVGTVVARYQVFYERGAPITLPLVLGDDGSDHAPDGAYSRTIPLDARRVVRYVRFEKADSPIAPVLLAVTVERNAAPNAAQTLVGQQTRFGVEVASVLTAETRNSDNTVDRLSVDLWNRRSHRLDGVVFVSPGGEAELRIAHAFGEDPKAQQSRAAAVLAQADPLEAHRNDYHRWFADNCPRWRSGDPQLDRLWWYRWFVVRHNLARPATGNLPDTVFYEGRHGDWYPKLISFASPHIIAEARWLLDPEPARNQIRAHLATADQAGLLQSARVDWSGAYYTHWIALAATELHQVHPEEQFLREITPRLAQDVLATLERFDGDGDSLPAAPGLYASGMEFQPSQFFHANYDNSGDPTTLERPDFAAYLYGNARAVESLYLELGDTEQATRMATIAERVREAVLNKLWDEQDRYFYAIRESDDSPAFCAEIAAFYPWFVGLPPDEFRYGQSLSHLVAADRFRTPVPFASCSQQVPAFSARLESWPGPGGHTEHCMWNGPVWPHANSVIANVLGRVITEYEHHDLRVDDLRELLFSYARLQFENGDPTRPLVRETANTETGEMWGCPDYFHSTWIDLVCRYHELLGWPSPTAPDGESVVPESD